MPTHKGRSMIRTTLEPFITTDLFQLKEWQDARKKAQATNGRVYSWKTTGTANWLERGFSLVDSLGLVVLPRGLPRTMTMPNDHPSGCCNTHELYGPRKERS